MNEIVKLENEQNDMKIKSEAGANLALDKIRVMLSGQNSPSQRIIPQLREKEEEGTHYDRMSRKDFSRKSNSYASVLMNDNRYSKFRFANKRSTNQDNINKISPLSSISLGRYTAVAGDCDYSSTGGDQQQRRHPCSVASGASLLRTSNSAMRSAKMMSSLANNPSYFQHG